MKPIEPTPWDSDNHSWIKLRIYYVLSGLCKVLDGLVQVCSVGVFYSDFTGRFIALWVS